ncbi:MAG: hypothetical protein ABS45_08075 [Comamonas sp. SCN 65-56]|nr:type II toxin-antitoxin system prevent-host-death family antitoxin [uncultured Comamonas sp.]ODS92042.1 MAG: hypothetical protein ABS45_08075 [Comamonas sp. SCN 65-56]
MNATATAVGLFEAKTRLSEYVARAERGEEVIITRHNKPVARIVPIAAQAAMVAEKVPPFVQRTFHSGVPLVDLTKANQLAGAMEDQHFLELNRRLEAEAAARKKTAKTGKA